MMAAGRLASGLACCGLVAAAGWASIGEPVASPARRPVEPVRPPSRPVERVAPMPEPSLSLPSTSALDRRVTPDIALTEHEQEYLRHDPEQWAQEQAEASRPLRDQLCRARLPSATADQCERIFQAFTGVTSRYLSLQQRFLRGQIGQDAYQEEFHRIMLEQTVALESAMSARDYFAYLGIPQGEDVFIDLNGGIMRMESTNFRLGDEVFDREVQR